MTPIERVDQRMKGLSWDEAEEVGIEILARCTALHVYARKEDGKYLAKLGDKLSIKTDEIMSLLERICIRGDEWAHEGYNASILAFAAVGYEEQMRKKSEEHGKD